MTVSESESKSAPLPIEAITFTSLLACAYETPRLAPPETPTPMATALISGVAVALTVIPPVTSIDALPETRALTSLGCRCVYATAPLRATPMPAATAIACVRAVLLSSASTERLETVPVSPMVASPTEAFVDPVRFTTPIETPAATPPIAPPIVSAATLRSSFSALTVIPPTARWIVAESSIFASCVLESISTVTCAPTPTAPPPPAKAMVLVASLRPAWTLRLPPAEMTAVPPTSAVVSWAIVPTRSEAPTPTAPPAAEPTMPPKPMLSSAFTLTSPEAVTFPKIWAVVPGAIGVVSASPVGLPSALPFVWMVEAGPLVCALIRDWVF